MASQSGIPVVDLSPFLSEDMDDEMLKKKKKKRVVEIVKEACSEYGFFQIVNHGVPTELMKRALQLSKTFFELTDEEKRKFSAGDGAPLPAGYSRQPLHSVDKNEYLLVFPPQSPFNIYPTHPSQLREVVEEVFSYLSNTGSLIESIINDCLGLPPGFLQKFNSDRNWDFMTPLRYFPATDSEDNGITPHQDGNSVTFVFQDDAGGLEVLRDEIWIPATPSPDAIVVNIGDVIQVVSNNKFKSATHRVVRPKGRSRHSYAFFYNLSGEKFVEPLPQFTSEIGEPPKYRKFEYGEYMKLRLRNKTHPPQSPEDVIHITHYSIN
ncbi:Flavonol synthase/flavanone 3-hydroxylase (Fragment) [Linum perenne]